MLYSALPIPYISRLANLTGLEEAAISSQYLVVAVSRRGLINQVRYTKPLQLTPLYSVVQVAFQIVYTLVTVPRKADQLYVICAIPLKKGYINIMYRVLTHRILISILTLLMVVSPLATGCRGVAPSDSAAVQDAAVEVVDGGEFNKFFPPVSGEFDIIYTQEKAGFAQAKLEQNGAEMATFSVSDTANNPDAADKFQNAEFELAGYPLATVGSLGSAILVADRFQVQIRSKDDTFTAGDREAWLAEFDLDGIASLK